jgi:hypothetical protein
MESTDDIAEAGKTARNLSVEVELVTVVEANAGVGVPENDSIVSAKGAFSLAEILFDSVFASLGIEEGFVPEHDLVARVAMGGPGEIGVPIGGPVVKQSLAGGSPPRGQFSAPRFTFPGIARGSDNLRHIVDHDEDDTAREATMARSPPLSRGGLHTSKTL